MYSGWQNGIRVYELSDTFKRKLKNLDKFDMTFPAWAIKQSYYNGKYVFYVTPKPTRNLSLYLFKTKSLHELDGWIYAAWQFKVFSPKDESQ